MIQGRNTTRHLTLSHNFSTGCPHPSLQPPQHQLPTQQQQSITDEFAEPVASPEDEEADPQVKQQDDIPPEMEEDKESNSNPTAIA